MIDNGNFVHPALFYRSDQEYLDCLVPFVTDGLAVGEPVAVAVPGPRLDVLREGLGAAAERITLLDMTREGRNPGRIIPRVLRRFADAHRDRHVRIIGEPIWAARSDTEYPACAQHEALINMAFAGRDVTIVCPYDMSTLSAEALDDAVETHPLIWDSERRYDSDRYAPEAVIARYNRPLADTGPDDAVLRVGTPADLPAARRFGSDRARVLGLAEERVADLELIVTELVANSLRHAGGPSRLGVWRENGHLVCEVRDTGELTDPLVGRRPAEPGQTSGYGLLLVNDLADLVRVHTGPGGTTVRVLFTTGD
ncbi:sensor histidine kinase [Allokutzneria sp. A3M-2-11 16]|uniref:sensor histidine kinase n=1 Tax=Allokutzneria sp. A3M-2-11 16 TaxID=2962043 RepID=UPI0020B7C884|nr:sensor histidine kinase [Allokutzneria sp. A3M-2-11 16]MCP3802361.1 sensor histidine kinase [Allokutzneria sp. A3M-2-11 16]